MPRLRVFWKSFLSVATIGGFFLALWAVCRPDAVRVSGDDPVRFEAERFVDTIEGAGSARYHSDRYTLDLLGLNYHPLAHAGMEGAERTCLIVGYQPALLLVPSDWRRQLEPAFDLQLLRVFHVPRWSVINGHGSRTVLALAARARPEILQSCRVWAGASPE